MVVGEGRLVKEGGFEGAVLAEVGDDGVDEGVLWGVGGLLEGGEVGLQGARIEQGLGFCLLAGAIGGEVVEIGFADGAKLIGKVGVEDGAALFVDELHDNLIQFGT